MRYKVTGGNDGDLGIEHQGVRYEAGDVVEMPEKSAEWLVELGLLEADGSGKKSSKAVVAEVAPAEETDEVGEVA
jgi:hypothetical protein